MRKHLKTLLESIHLLLLFSTVLPILYMLGMERETGMIYRLYFAGYILFLSIIGVKKAASGCKTLPGYLLCSAAVLILTSIPAFGLGRFILSQTINGAYMLYIVLGTIAAFLESYFVRMHSIRRQRAKERMDSSFKQSEIALEKPKPAFCCYFICIYLLALNFDCAEVCNIAVVSTLCYLLISIGYQYIDRMEAYLNINNNACNLQNIPYKRIFGIGKYFVFSYLFLILLAIIPALLTTNLREYRDFRQWILEREVDETELSEAESHRNFGVDPEMEAMELMGPPKEMPLFLKLLFQGAMLLLFAAILIALIRWIKEELSTFSQGIDESGDYIESLTAADRESAVKPIVSPHSQKKEDKIRKEYRKFVKKHRKERPAVHETPTEIEILAGVAQTEKGKELHEQYELARYGRKL